MEFDNKIDQLNAIVATKEEEVQNIVSDLRGVLYVGIESLSRPEEIKLWIDITDKEIQFSIMSERRTYEKHKLSLYVQKKYDGEVYTIDRESSFSLWTGMSHLDLKYESSVLYVRLISFITDITLARNELYSQIVDLYESYQRKLAELKSAKENLTKFKTNANNELMRRLVYKIIPTIKEGDVYLIHGAEITVDKVTDACVFYQYYDRHTSKYGYSSPSWVTKRPKKYDFAVSILSSLPKRIRRIIELTEKIPSSLASNRPADTVEY
jgi:hypothetical protein